MTNEQLNEYLEHLIDVIDVVGKFGEFFEIPLELLTPVAAAASGLHGMADANNPAEQQRLAQKLLHDAHLDQSHLLHKANPDPSGKESRPPIGSQHPLNQQRLAQKLLHDAKYDPAGQRLAQKLLHDAHLDQSHLLHKANPDPSGNESTQAIGSQHPVNQQPHVNHHPIGQSSQKAHGQHPLNNGSSAHVGALALGSQQAHGVHGNNAKGLSAQVALGQMPLHSGSVTPPHPGSPHPQVTPPQPVLDFVLQKLHRSHPEHLVPAPMSHGPDGNLRHDGLHARAGGQPHFTGTPQKAAPQAVHKTTSKAVHKSMADASTALKNAGHGGSLHPHAKHPAANHHSAKGTAGSHHPLAPVDASKIHSSAPAKPAEQGKTLSPSSVGHAHFEAHTHQGPSHQGPVHQGHAHQGPVHQDHAHQGAHLQHPH